MLKENKPIWNKNESKATNNKFRSSMISDTQSINYKIKAIMYKKRRKKTYGIKERSNGKIFAIFRKAIAF